MNPPNSPTGEALLCPPYRRKYKGTVCRWLAKIRKNFTCWAPSYHAVSWDDQQEAGDLPEQLGPKPLYLGMLPPRGGKFTWAYCRSHGCNVTSFHVYHSPLKRVTPYNHGLSDSGCEAGQSSCVPVFRPPSPDPRSSGLHMPCAQQTHSFDPNALPPWQKLHVYTYLLDGELISMVLRSFLREIEHQARERM